MNEKYATVVKRDDFVVYMDDFQADLLYRFGNEIIAYVNTHGTNPKKYHLHTILIINKDCEGIAVAFMISNRNDKDILKVFLESIKDKIGIISPEILMSDMQSSFYNAFVEVMSPIGKWLWFTWYVYKKW